MSKIRLLPLIIVLCSCSLYGQAIKALEKDLVNTFIEHREYHDSVNEIIRRDSTRLNSMLTMAHIDSLCLNKILYYTSKFPQTIGMDFKLLRAQDVNIMTSDDSLFRIYVWNERRMLSGPAYKSIFQYKAGGKVMSCTLPHPDTALTGAYLAFFFSVYTVTINKKTYYLVTYLNKYKPVLREEGIKVFTIAKDKLNDTCKIIRTETGLHNELSYKYDVTALPDGGNDNEVFYDTVKRAIEIPVVLENGKLTDGHITYKLKGKYFEKVEPKKNEE